MSEAVHVKQTPPFLLVCMHSLRLTSIKQSADYTGFMYIDFSMFCQPVVALYTFCRLRESHGGLPNSLNELTVKMEMLCVMVDARYINP